MDQKKTESKNSIQFNQKSKALELFSSVVAMCSVAGRRQPFTSAPQLTRLSHRLIHILKT